jgi:hypothetical protein
MKPKKTSFAPFANEADVLEVGNLAFENRLDRITVSGDLDITADQQGLAAARLLQALLGQIVDRLQAQDLPEQLPAAKVKKVDNPFA